MIKIAKLFSLINNSVVIITTRTKTTIIANYDNNMIMTMFTKENQTNPVTLF